MHALVRSVTSVALLLVAGTALAYSTPKTQPWKAPNGSTLNVPVGWRVDTNTWDGGLLVEMSHADKLVLVVISPGQDGPVGRIHKLLAGIKASPLQPTSPRVSPNGDIALLEAAKMTFRGQQHLGVVLGMQGRSGGVTALFIARPLSFRLNAGEEMLSAVLPMGQGVLEEARAARLPPLAGAAWTNVSAGAFEQASAPRSGTSLQLNPNGSYRYVFASYITSGACQSKNETQEVGRWSLDGNQLTLAPSGHDGIICACCRPGKKGEVVRGRGPARTYTVRSTQKRRANIVLNGPCASFDHRPHCKQPRTYDYYFMR